jgi:hypothetical protein
MSKLDAIIKIIHSDETQAKRDDSEFVLQLEQYASLIQGLVNVAPRQEHDDDSSDEFTALSAEAALPKVCK